MLRHGSGYGGRGLEWPRPADDDFTIPLLRRSSAPIPPSTSPKSPYEVERRIFRTIQNALHSPKSSNVASARAHCTGGGEHSLGTLQCCGPPAACLDACDPRAERREAEPWVLERNYRSNEDWRPSSRLRSRQQHQESSRRGRDGRGRREDRCCGKWGLRQGSRRELRAAPCREHQERRLHSHHRRPHRLREEPDAARGRATRLTANLRHHRCRERDDLRATHLRRQRHRDRRVLRPGQDHHHPRHGVCSRRAGKGRRVRRGWRGPQSGDPVRVGVRGPGQVRPTGPGDGWQSRIWWAGAEVQGGVRQDHAAAGGHAGCGYWRVACRSGQWVCGQQPASWPDGQGGCASAVYGGGHLGSYPALGRYEGQQGHCGDQQGCRCTYLSGCRCWPCRGSLREGP